VSISVTDALWTCTSTPFNASCANCGEANKS
jgi:hypothetical protein